MTGGGEVLLDWAGSIGLTLLNEGAVATCVRPQGESIVDLTWASPAALRMLGSWRVAAELETLPDHRYIEFGLAAPHQPSRSNSEPDRRWSLTKLDPDLLMASVHALLWTWRKDAEEWEGLSPEEWALRLRKALWEACDASMPRVKKGCGKKSVYWWIEEIAGLREASVQARRRLQRCLRRRRRNEECTERAQEECRIAKHSLSDAIGRSETTAWKELISSLNEDPWGRHCRIVLSKLRTRAPSTTESLAPAFLGEVVDTLFPREAGGRLSFLSRGATLNGKRSGRSQRER